MKPVVASRGFDAEAGHEDRALAEAAREVQRQFDLVRERVMARADSLRQSNVIPHERGEE